MAESQEPPIFKGLVIFLPSSFSQIREQQLRHMIETHAGTATRSPTDATHVVTNSHRFEGWQAFEGEGKPSVCTELWLERSVTFKKLQPTAPYSADPSKLFSGVIGCAADLSPSDIEVLSAGIPSLGGQWRTGLTKDVTHLFTLGTDSEKYRNALDYQTTMPIKIVLPHWFDDVIKLGMVNLAVDPYEWPDPILLRPTGSFEKKKSPKLDSDKQALFSSVSLDANTAPAKISPKKVFDKRKVLVGTTLELGERRKAIEAFVEMADGEVISLEGDRDTEKEAQKVLECDIFVTKYRNGPAYFKAARAGKIIASLSWLFHVFSVGVLTAPLDQLLHYPIPKKLIEGFDRQQITITNFTGESREYLKKLICTMGGGFTPSMSSKNTVLIAAQQDGTKTDRARTWGIPIVNHLWLEDCFVHWKNITVGLDRYLLFPQGSDFAPRLGERGLGKDVEAPAELDRLEDEEIEDAEKAERVRLKVESPMGVVGPSRTQDSARDAWEAADIAMGVDEPVGEIEDNNMDVDLEPRNPVKRTPRITTPKSKPKLDSSSLTRRVSRSARRVTTEEDNEDGLPKISKRSPMKLSSRRLRIIDSEEMNSGNNDNSEKENKRRIGSKISEKKSAANGQSRKLHGNDEPKSEENSDDHAPLPPKALPKPKPKKTKTETKRVPVDSDIDMDPSNSESESDRDVMHVRRKSITTKGKGRARQIDVESEDDSIDDNVASNRKKQKQKAATALKSHGPPSSGTEHSASDAPAKYKVPRQGPSPKKVAVVIGKVPSSGSKTLAKHESIHVASSERPTPSSSLPATSTSPATHRPARRAAERASQQLRDTVMPDVVSYEAEMKRRRRQSSSALPRDKDKPEDSDEEISKPVGKGKERRTEETLSVGKKRKVSDGSDAEESEVLLMSPPKKAKKRKAGSVRVLTSQVNLADDTKKAFEKLGAKLVTKPSECTHLIAPKILRTEKFLCALAVSPWILTEKWLHDSIKANALLLEESYFLPDKSKWNIDLKKSLERAKKSKHPLFASRIFYVTPGVFSPTMTPSLLENVIKAFGGKMVQVQGAVTERSLISMRHLVTCEADKPLWLHLAKKHYIHNVELVLRGVLEQKLDFDKPEFHIKGTWGDEQDD